MHECGVRGFLESEHLGFSLLQLIPNLLRDLGQVNESLVSGRSWERVSGLLEAREWKMSVNNPTVGYGAFEGHRRRGAPVPRFGSRDVKL